MLNLGAFKSTGIIVAVYHRKFRELGSYKITTRITDSMELVYMVYIRSETSRKQWAPTKHDNERYFSAAITIFPISK